MNHVILHWNCGQYPTYLTADYDLLIRMLIHVLSNAVEHTPQGGNVTFDVWEKNNKLAFRITDTGNGFSDDILENAAVVGGAKVTIQIPWRSVKKEKYC